MVPRRAALVLLLAASACEEDPQGTVVVRGREYPARGAEGVLLPAASGHELRVLARVDPSRRFADDETSVRVDVLVGADAKGELPFEGEVRVASPDNFAATGTEADIPCSVLDPNAWDTEKVARVCLSVWWYGNDNYAFRERVRGRLVIDEHTDSLIRGRVSVYATAHSAEAEEAWQEEDIPLSDPLFMDGGVELHVPFRAVVRR